MLKGFFYNQSMLIAQDIDIPDIELPIPLMPVDPDVDGIDIWTPFPFQTAFHFG